MMDNFFIGQLVKIYENNNLWKFGVINKIQETDAEIFFVSSNSSNFFNKSLIEELVININVVELIRLGFIELRYDIYSFESIVLQKITIHNSETDNWEYSHFILLNKEDVNIHKFEFNKQTEIKITDDISKKTLHVKTLNDLFFELNKRKLQFYPKKIILFLTNTELNLEGNKFKKLNEFDIACYLYKELWERVKSTWNGYYYAYCLRKIGKYNEASLMQKNVLEIDLNFKPIQNEILWLDYILKIKKFIKEDENSIEKLLSDAEKIISKTDINDTYTRAIFTKTVLAVVGHLFINEKYLESLKWLDKLDFGFLSKSTYLFKEKVYTSDYKRYFMGYAYSIIKLNSVKEYIHLYFKILNFDGFKLNSFVEKTFSQVHRFENPIPLFLAKKIKRLKEEIRYRKLGNFQLVYNSNKKTLVSNLGDYVFCPASFALNETFDIKTNNIIEYEEFEENKIKLIDRYKDFNNKKSIDLIFSDTSIEINKQLTECFFSIFNSKLISDNHDGLSPNYYSNNNDTLRGNPEYIFEDSLNKKYVVIEKFTHRTPDDIKSPFPNDLVRILAYIFEFENQISIDHGILIYWFWNYEITETFPIEIYTKIRAYKIFRIEKSIENKNFLEKTIEQIEEFKKSKLIVVDGDKLSWANKCLHCSVMSFCNHKTGKFDEIKLPYDISALKLKNELD